MLFPTLGPSSLPVLITQPDERHANRTACVLKSYDRHRAYIVQRLVQHEEVLPINDQLISFAV